jgi:hypothetical protein
MGRLFTELSTQLAGMMTGEALLSITIRFSAISARRFTSLATPKQSLDPFARQQRRLPSLIFGASCVTADEIYPKLRCRTF